MERNKYVPRNFHGSGPEALRTNMCCKGKCDQETYRFAEEDDTAWISSKQADFGTEARPFPSSIQQNGKEYIVKTQKNTQNGRSYHKVISIMFAASLLQVWYH